MSKLEATFREEICPQTLPDADEDDDPVLGWSISRESVARLSTVRRSLSRPKSFLSEHAQSGTDMQPLATSTRAPPPAPPPPPLTDQVRASMEAAAVRRRSSAAGGE